MLSEANSFYWIHAIGHKRKMAYHSWLACAPAQNMYEEGADRSKLDSLPYLHGFVE